MGDGVWKGENGNLGNSDDVRVTWQDGVLGSSEVDTSGSI